MAENRPSMVIAIDGPAGSGKSTVARKLAKKLGFVHLNSGLLFRSLAREAQREALALDDDHRLAELARSMEFRYALASADGSTRFLVNGVDLGAELATASAGELASRVAVLPEVRSVFAGLQQQIAVTQSLVVEGRDAGSVVFPAARFKFYLEASAEIRAERRYRELSQAPNSSNALTFEQVLSDLRQRDERDSTRSVAPQVKATDAMLIDTSHMSADEVVDKLYSLVTESGE